jgi:polysaccharide chain length determinant protein (PEP-CTERM system associated)
LFTLYIELFFVVLRELIRYRKLAVLLFTSIFFVGLLLIDFWPRTYKTAAVVAINHTNVIEPLLRGAAEVPKQPSQEKVIDTLLSRNVLESAAQKIAAAANETLTRDLLEKNIQSIRASIDVSPVNNNPNLTSITLVGTEPNSVFQTLDVLIATFLENRALEKQRDSFEAFSFIEVQANQYKSQLEEAEKKLKEFKERSADVSEESVKARIAELTAEVKYLTVSIEETKEVLSSTKQQLIEETSFVADKSEIKSLEQRRKLLSIDLDRLLLSFHDEYPDIIALRQQIAEIDSALNKKGAMLSRVSGSEESDRPLFEELRKKQSSSQLLLSTQLRRLEALQKLLSEEEQLSDRVAGYQAELAELTRDYSVTKQQYEEMLVRKENAKLTMALNNEGQGENYRLVQSPVFPLEPDGFKPVLLVLAAFAIAFCTPLALCVLYVLVDPRIRLSSRLIEVLPEGVTYYGEIPQFGASIFSGITKKEAMSMAIYFALMLALLGYSMLSTSNSVWRQLIDAM